MDASLKTFFRKKTFIQDVFNVFHKLFFSEFNIARKNVSYKKQIQNIIDWNIEKNFNKIILLDYQYQKREWNYSIKRHVRLLQWLNSILLLIL